ncbi:AAA family ATPase [Flavobacterium denitrificans]|uniref:AAA family ATPase n=1 Tax=Flavobacterium denitrificans TaxID=281361 RepID=UPI0003FFDF63|nr:AAA family ATPase [Flavobacterium denitrificans]
MNHNIIFKDKKGGDDSNNYYFNDSSETLIYLPKFNDINIIVGANNSGKSMFIRYFMNSDNIIGVDIDNLKKHQEFLNNSFRALRSRFKEIKNSADINDTIKENLEIFERSKYNFSQEIQNTYIESISNLIKDFSKCKRYYIPTLRSAHSLFRYTNPGYQKIENDIFLETLNYYYKLNNKKVNIFTGIHLYKEILNTRNSKREIRESFEKFEDFIGKYFFDGKKVDIVAEFNKDESLAGNNNLENISVHIEGEKETRDLFRLGDGVQAIIILMYKIFMAEGDSFIFIDEPELNLHPGMQRLFLEQITNNDDLKKKNLTYIITTHSNHFLDLTIEKENVSIYSFSPKKITNGEKQFIIKNVNRGDNELLRNLGVNNSSVFMANCSIWVEGISDRNYIKAFLKSYCDFIKKSYPKEDIDFAFFEYAGSNIEHYIFEDEVEKEDVEIILKDIKALSISNRIFLLADSDASKKNSKKGIRLKELEEAKTDNFIPKVVWNIREVENLLTNEMWQEVLIELCNKTLVKSNETEILLKIKKVLSEVNYSDFAKKYVGEFLEQIRNKMGKISSIFILNQSAYEVKSDGSFGTINNKRDLSELVFNANFSWEILSKNKEIENLTIEIYNFITQKE